MQKLPSCVLALGFAILIGAAVVGWIIVPKVINNKIAEQVRLVNGSETFNRWRDVPVPIFVKFHLFNVTNPKQVLIGEKAILQEVGPFTFRQKRQKVDIKIHKRNDTISYRQTLTYFYQPELSTGSLQDVITVINIPFLGMVHRAAKQSAFSRSMMLEFLADEQVFVQKTIDEMLFKGYYVDFMEDFAKFIGYKLLPNDTFGLYYGKNGSDQGVFEVYSGIKDTSKFGVIASWNGSPEMPWWEPDSCKKISGTDGAIFPPFVTTDRKLNMFSSDLCRSLRLIYEKESEVGGVPSYKFIVDPEVLEDPVFNRDNMCYCTQPGSRFENCPKQGAYQINACRKETPLLVSLPHFLDGSSEYLNKTEGLHPDRSLHETFIELEPTSGLLLKAAKRIQVNMELRPFKFIKQFKKVPSMLFPLVWVDESAMMSEDGRGRLKAKLIAPQTYSNYGAWGGVALGLLIIVIATIIYLIRARKKNYHT
ncbi:lysosome membrane protein 2 [Folsomia candida]|uniref:lysosome membrane protein 2 n=1 Tax=Folsomia candida TaxID=158441 RepID=UPI000B8FF4DD|nr:lysosome membrane protein 2 [Folsomia candida]